MEGLLMRTQLKINGELKDVEIENGELTIVEPEKKATGWERVKKDSEYCYWCGDDRVDKLEENYLTTDNNLYLLANYFSSEELFTNISRMQTLQRKMFRWQAKNDKPINFNDWQQVKYEIYYCHRDGTFGVCETYACTYGFIPYFSTREKAEECIGAFKDEWMWLFTEFRWRMDD